MAKSVKKVVSYSLVLLVLAVVALLTAPFFLDINEYKSQIERQVEDSTGRKMSVGTIKASLFPWVGVQLEDVHLANRSGFSEHDFLSVQQLHVKLALLPLLSRKLEIKKFEISAPRLYLERHSDGEVNWSDLLSTPNADPMAVEKSNDKPPSSSDNAAPMLASLMADSISLSDGELIWHDAQSGAPLTISGLDVVLNDVQLDRPVSVHISGQLSGNGFDVKANVGPLGELDRLAFAKVPVQGEIKTDNFRLQSFQQYITAWPELMGDLAEAFAGLSVRFEQHPDGVRLSEGEALLEGAHALGLNWKIEMRKDDQLDVRFASLVVDGKETVDVKGNLSKLSSSPEFDIRLNSEPLSRLWLAGFVPELDSMYAGNSAPWQQIRFAALLAGDPGSVTISDLQLMLDKELLQASGSVRFKGPVINLNVLMRDLHLNPWMPKSAEALQQEQDEANQTSRSTTSTNDDTVDVEPDLRGFKALRVKLKVKANTIFLHGLEMQNFLMELKGSKGKLNLNPLSFNLAGGRVVEKASINIAAYPVRWTESVQIKDVDVAPLLKSLADMEMLEGRLEMNTRLKATGLTAAAVRSLNGRGDFSLGEGKIRGFDIAGALRRFTQPGAAAGVQETDFSELSGSFDIRNGIATNKDLFMASPLLRVTGHGKVNLVKKEMDYHVKPRVVGTLKGQGDTVALRRGLSIPLHISGAFDAPKVRLEVNAKTLINNGPALLKKGKVGRALGKILGDKPANQDATGKQEQDNAKPADIIRKGIGGLIQGF